MPETRAPKRSRARRRLTAFLHQHPQLRQTIIHALAVGFRVRVLTLSARGVLRYPGPALTYLLRGRELDNLTYDITNTDDLVPVIADTLGCEHSLAATYLEECVKDHDLHSRLTARLATRDDRPDAARFGRRYGWYVVTRIIKPRLVVETGAHDGLGSALLIRALERNAEQGHPGELLSFDINSTSGWLLDPPPPNWRLVVGDSKQTLASSLRGRQVDLFIHDSLHTVEHETFEFDVAITYASANAVLITDNAKVTNVLRDLASGAGVRFGQFDERLEHHWYGGEALGIAALGTDAQSSVALDNMECRSGRPAV